MSSENNPDRLRPQPSVLSLQSPDIFIEPYALQVLVKDDLLRPLPNQELQGVGMKLVHILHTGNHIQGTVRTLSQAIPGRTKCTFYRW